MRKIASPNELASELRSLLAYAEGDQPSREKLASGLRALAQRVASSLPELRGLLSTLSRLPGVDEAYITDQWREGSDTLWYSVRLKLKAKDATDVVTRRHGPHTFAVIEFETKPRSVALQAERIVDKAGGYSIEVGVPNRKRTWIDPEYPRASGEPASYYDGSEVSLEFYMGQSTAEGIR